MKKKDYSWIYSASEVAEYLNINVFQVSRLVKAKRLTPIKIVAQRYLFDFADVKKFKEETPVIFREVNKKS